MADWVTYVRRHLRLTGLSETREAEIVEDVARQLEDAYREALASGATEPEARVRAERHISDWHALARDVSTMTHGKKPQLDLWSDRANDRAAARGRFTWAGRLVADARYGVRMMLRTPGFSALSILMLALGTGANAAVFSVVDAVMLRSPFERGHEIAGVTVVGSNGRTSAVPRETFERLAGIPQIVAAAEYSISSPIIRGIDQPRRGQVECVPVSMRDVLGAQPLVGRWFSKDEDRPDAQPVGVVSHAFWQRALGGDPNVIGRRIRLDEATVTIIGVMRPGFDGALSRILRDVWVPLGQLSANPGFGCRAPGATANGFVRLKPGLSMEEATAAVAAAIGQASPSDPKSRLALYSVDEETLGSVKPMFTALMGAVVAVLLIACANVANLGLARLIGRRREIAVRLALGATRAGIVRQTVIEQLVVASFGAVAGLILARLTLDGVISLLPRGLPHAETVALNGRTLAVSIGVTLLAAVAVGLIPAMQASSVRLRAGLAADDRTMTAGGQRIRWVLVVGELALGVMLLVGALLMIRTFLILRPTDPGFDFTNKMVANVALPAQMSAEAKDLFAAELSRQLLASPGVAAVARVSQLPIAGTRSFIPFIFDGQTGETVTETYTTNISANFLDVLRVRIVRGRGLLDSDSAATEPVALANEAFVRRWLKGREPLNAAVTIGPGMKPTIQRRIVGIVPDMRFTGSDLQPRPQLFFPIAQAGGASNYIISAAPSALATMSSTVRQIVTALKPDQPVDRVDPFEKLLDGEVAYQRLGAWLLGIFGGLAVLLSAVGLGSTLAWSVAERRREIGVRMALGASPGAIRALVVRQTLALAVIALAIGLTSAVFASRLVERWLYGVARTDVLTYAICGASMLAVALVAAYLPTRRATRVDPLQTLRAD